MTQGHDLDRPLQSYISNSNDPYLNLSIEHHLLQKSGSSSTVLLLYVNRPCVVIGRNQNPWTESPLLKNDPKTIDLVRRRSGGGTVFHDKGNVNWTVISPADSFTRDKHAEMVTRALRRCGIQRCRVNERHDIVLDQGGTSSVEAWGPDDDTHSTPWQHDAGRTVKVSGSAYKLTRGRALHHGTALLDSPNLNSIHDILTAPGKRHIDSKGVASVSSPVANIGLGNDAFIRQVQTEFGSMYRSEALPLEVVGEEWLEDAEVQNGFKELKSTDWTYLQTPKFSIHYKTDELQATIEVKNGRLEQMHARTLPGDAIALGQERFHGRKIHEVHDWQILLNESMVASSPQAGIARWASWLRQVLPPVSGAK
ncbi:hypothetical protein ANO11243_052360 [Dothideomycetidae sp. 11243]|nr:hypothetical protein ANO11243_052360 [fungal sp. No.11243]